MWFSFSECLIKRNSFDCVIFFVGNYWRMRVAKIHRNLGIFLNEITKIYILNLYGSAKSFLHQFLYLEGIIKIRQ